MRTKTIPEGFLESKVQEHLKLCVEATFPNNQITKWITPNLTGLEILVRQARADSIATVMTHGSTGQLSIEVWCRTRPEVIHKGEHHLITRAITCGSRNEAWKIAQFLQRELEGIVRQNLMSCIPEYWKRLTCFDLNQETEAPTHSTLIALTGNQASVDIRILINSREFLRKEFPKGDVLLAIKEFATWIGIFQRQPKHSLIFTADEFFGLDLNDLMSDFHDRGLFFG